MLWRGIYKKTLATAIISLLLVIANPLVLMAQQEDPDLPCDGADVYSECPLDTWSIVLLLAGLLLGVYFIYKNQYNLNLKTSPKAIREDNVL